MLEFCDGLKKSGLRNELNYETVKSVTAILENVESHHPEKVRKLLFKLL